MAKSLTQMAANIVAAQASHVSMSADEMDAALKKVFEALNQIKVLEETPAGEVVDDELARHEDLLQNVNEPRLSESVICMKRAGVNARHVTALRGLRGAPRA